MSFMKHAILCRLSGNYHNDFMSYFTSSSTRWLQFCSFCKIHVSHGMAQINPMFWFRAKASLLLSSSCLLQMLEKRPLQFSLCYHKKTRSVSFGKYQMRKAVFLIPPRESSSLTVCIRGNPRQRYPVLFH